MDVHGVVQVANGHDFTPDKVVEAVAGVGVQEAVPDPHPGVDLVAELVHQLKGPLHAVFAQVAATFVPRQGGFYRGGVEAQHVARLFADDHAQGARFVPVQVLRHHVDLAHERPFRPVVKHHRIGPSDGEAVPAPQPLRG